MRKIVALLIVLLGALTGSAQSGAEVLRGVSEKMGTMGAYRIDFELEMAGAENPSEGFWVVDGERYIVGLEDMKQGYDGEVVWVLNGAAREVTLDTPPQNNNSRNLFENPTKAFDFAEELFDVESVESVADGRQWRLVLRPKEGVLGGIERVVLNVDKASLLPTRLGYDMAGAGLYFNILKVGSVAPTAEDFKVIAPEGFEVIDFR